MIPEAALTTLRAFLAEYSRQGYTSKLLHDNKTNGYEASISKETNSVVLRQGYFNGKPDGRKIELTSFDVLFKVDDAVFLKYVSDYSLEEYNERLAEALQLVRSFFEKKYTVTEERYVIFWKKRYLNIHSDKGAEHLLEVHRA